MEFVQTCGERRAIKAMPLQQDPGALTTKTTAGAPWATGLRGKSSSRQPPRLVHGEGDFQLLTLEKPADLNDFGGYRPPGRRGGFCIPRPVPGKGPELDIG